MMPEGLLLGLTNGEIQNLLKYLRSTNQVPLPPPIPEASGPNKKAPTAG